MHFSNIALATIAAAGPLANAHGAGLPQIIGLDVADLKARSLLRSIGAQLAESGHAHTAPVEARDSPPECGEGIGSCPAGKCCSRAGYCGTTDAYCYSPGCKYQYGPGCAENNPPAGTNTSSISREKLGSVAYGGDGIFRCVTPGTVALTYDDGPQTKFTDHILDLFKSYNAKATFFMTGNNINKGQIDIKHADVIKRVDAEGHQVASHTWTHLDLSKISSLDRKNQLWMNEMALRNVLGKIPTYMRPPYSSCTKDSGCQQDLADLGYHITNFNVDTDDYNQNVPEHIQKSKDWFKGNITKEGATAEKGDKWLSIGHDILDQTANNLTEYMLQTLTQLGYKAVTVGDCLGDPKENWYRKADGAGISVANNTQVSSTP
jgi:peptidoglycan/xylan/chitin deacetylase (PgdA/CDA1 family)